MLPRTGAARLALGQPTRVALAERPGLPPGLAGKSDCTREVLTLSETLRAASNSMTKFPIILRSRLIPLGLSISARPEIIGAVAPCLRGVVLCIAPSQTQAQVVLNYVAGVLEACRLLAARGSMKHPCSA